VRRIHPPPCPPGFDGPGSAAAAERQAAIAHFRAPDWSQREAEPGTRFAFKAYRNDLVRRTLGEAFGYVCAYCESPYDATQSPAIEHYRPKGMVACEDGPPLKPGYYWLATTWDNLLPSCTDCNSARGHVHVDETTKKQSGKANWFPVQDESQRARRPGDERHEAPLLLHPYHDEPADHLVYHEEAVMGAISDRGHATIRTIGLNRRGLVDRRRDKRTLVDLHLTNVAQLDDAIASDPANTVYPRLLQAEFAQLALLAKPGQPYAAMVRQRIREAVA